MVFELCITIQCEFSLAVFMQLENLFSIFFFFLKKKRESLFFFSSSDSFAILRHLRLAPISIDIGNLNAKWKLNFMRSARKPNSPKLSETPERSTIDGVRPNAFERAQVLKRVHESANTPPFALRELSSDQSSQDLKM